MAAEGRTASWVRDARPGHNPEQTDRSQQVLPYDPEAHDPFLMLAEDWFSRTGFGWHPHRGFETVTFVLEGELEHTDNAGGHGVLGAGDLQWTTTGRGVLHQELAHRRRPVHTLQLWLNLPARLKMVPPRYQDLRGAEAPVAAGEGAEARVFAGVVQGVRGRADTLWPATVADVRLRAGGRFAFDPPARHAAFLYVVSGRVQAGADRRPVAAGQVAWFPAPAADDADPARVADILVAADEASRVLAYAGQPIGEPVVARGPFVMNRPEEIVQAVRDFQAGRFGPVPAAGPDA